MLGFFKGVFGGSGWIAKLGIPHLGAAVGGLALMGGMMGIATNQQNQQQNTQLNQGSSTIVASIVNWAQTKLGSPYLFGGHCQPNGQGDASRCDCSSLVQSSYKFGAHLDLPRQANTQYKTAGSQVSMDQIQPGDLVFPKASFGEGGAAADEPGHVGMYIGTVNNTYGQDTIIEAPHTGDHVKYQHLHDGGYWSNSAIVRPKVLVQALMKGGQYMQVLGPSDIRGRPTLSPAFIDQVLAQAHSPAAGKGSTLYALSLQYGIDDAFALAFFQHESSFGTSGVARQTRSLGNIVCTGSHSNCIGRFQAYSSWEQGFVAWYKLLSGPTYIGGGLVTLPQIIHKYAPASDNNNEQAYVSAVLKNVSQWRAGKL